MGILCEHGFCSDCWEMHLNTHIANGDSTMIQCMVKDCHSPVPADFVADVVKDSKVLEKYAKNCLKEHVSCHPQLRFCPGPNCNVVVHAVAASKENKPQRVDCTKCGTTFCFTCGLEHHAPLDCKTFKHWQKKCSDDSETANYIAAHTKECPKCSTPIEKNEGCNHMICRNCRHEFCWVCMDNWAKHFTSYFKCNHYNEGDMTEKLDKNARAKENLKKYLFYYRRYENHLNSLKLEEVSMQKIRDYIQEKIDGKCGTWVDWQYLLDAGDLLKKCRYTLMHTYAYAYYLENGVKKTTFELIQSQLESNVEELAWKMLRAEVTDRADLEKQMNVAESRRITLLQDC